MRVVLKTAAVIAAAYLVLVGGLLAAMYQPPDRFGRIMAHAPGPIFAIVPFKSMWFLARKGTLKVGDAAPDFSLRTVDKKTEVALSSQRGKKPVVLVFGSYT